jgi:hypothetical protein
MEGSFLSDPNFQHELLKFLVHDRTFLKEASHLLTVKDFRSIDRHADNKREIVAGVALNFWQKNREPVGKLLNVELMQHARVSGWNKDNRERLLKYGKRLTNNQPKAATAILEKVQQYRWDVELASTMTKMQDMMETGTLTPDEFISIARHAVESVGKEIDSPKDIFDMKELENRIARRMVQNQRQRFPVLMIDPIDRLIRIIARRHMGLVLAPYGRGKTLFFVWLALAYVLQGYNVLHFTLEDPREDVEDRFDAAITSLPLVRLPELPNRLKKKFKRYMRLVRSRLKIVDGTEGEITMGAVENIWEQERNRGFTADAVIIDYDDEIRPMRKQSEKRFELADIYRDFRQFIARRDLLGWIASQTGRKSEELKIIGGHHVAEDISKMRKASFAMSLGQGDWGEESIYCWIAKHRYDMSHVGANICMDKKRAIFYDREMTLQKEMTELVKEETAV